MFNKILVATDLDEVSTEALRVAVSLARDEGSSLHIVHVLLDPMTQPWGADAYGINIPNLLADMRRDASRALDVLVAEATPKVADVRSQVLVGSPAAEIVRYAAAESIDLIVVGTHGRGVVPRAFLGSVADRVIREAPCPVLTVRHKAANRGARNAA